MSNDNRNNVVAFKPKSIKSSMPINPATQPNDPLDTGPITYKQLVERYGEKAAYAMLVSLEKIAKINNGGNYADVENKFRFALDKLSQDPTIFH